MVFSHATPHNESTASVMLVDFLINVGIGTTLLASVTLTWNQPLWTTVLLAALFFLQWKHRVQPGDRIVMITAALLGTPGELLEVSLGEWTYHAPHLIWGIPMWIPLVWANLFVLFRRLTRSTLQLLTHLWPGINTPHWRTLFGSLAIGIILLWITALLLMQKQVEILAFYAFFMVLLGGFWNKEPQRLLFLIAASIGAFGEYLCIQLGYWHYNQPYFESLGVDITLPLDWGISAILIHQIAEALKKTPNKSGDH